MPGTARMKPSSRARPARPSSRTARPPRSWWRSRLGAAGIWAGAFAVVILIGGVMSGALGPSRSPALQPSGGESTRASSPSPSSAASSPTASSEGRPFNLYTHCGLDRSPIEINGSFWKVTGPGPLSDGQGNPPAGFGNPYDQGMLTMLDDRHAMFVSSKGVRIDLVRLDERPEIPLCL
ncbi:MAG: hypothetical protein ACXWDF_09685 [Aeromicrobium sp.]